MAQKRPTRDLSKLPRRNQEPPVASHNDPTSRGSAVNIHQAQESASDHISTVHDQNRPNHQEPSSSYTSSTHSNLQERAPRKSKSPYHQFKIGMLLLVIIFGYRIYVSRPLRLRMHLHFQGLTDVKYSVQNSSIRIQWLLLDHRDELDSTMGNLSISIQNAASGLSHLHHTVVQLAGEVHRLSTEANCNERRGGFVARPTSFDSIVDRLKNAVELCSHVVALLDEEREDVYVQLSDTKQKIIRQIGSAVQFWNPNLAFQTSEKLEILIQRLERESAHLNSQCGILWAQKNQFSTWNQAFQSFHQDVATNATPRCATDTIWLVQRRFVWAIREAMSNDTQWKEFYADYQSLQSHTAPVSTFLRWASTCMTQRALAS